jgi:hypothetical protein
VLVSDFPAIRVAQKTRRPAGPASVIRQLMRDAYPIVDVRHLVYEMGAAVRGRWPLMLRTGWVVVRRITWV